MSQSLPAWAIDGLAAAGLSAEGWTERSRVIGYNGGAITIERCGHIEDGLCNIEAIHDKTCIPIAEAFGIAARLIACDSAALENKPCERCGDDVEDDELTRFGFPVSTTPVPDFYGRIKELEAENERLRLEHAHLKGAAQQAANIAYNSKGVNLKPENLERIVALLDEAVAHKAVLSPEQEPQENEPK
jgi:hypothetical protein